MFYVSKIWWKARTSSKMAAFRYAAARGWRFNVSDVLAVKCDRISARRRATDLSFYTSSRTQRSCVFVSAVHVEQAVTRLIRCCLLEVPACLDGKTVLQLATFVMRDSTDTTVQSGAHNDERGVCMSVSLSVTRWYWVKTNDRRMIQFSLGTCEASRFDSNSNRRSRFDSKVTGRFENFESPRLPRLPS